MGDKTLFVRPGHNCAVEQLISTMHFTLSTVDCFLKVVCLICIFWQQLMVFDCYCVNYVAHLPLDVYRAQIKDKVM